MLMLRGLPVLIELGLLIYCLIDCIQSDRIVIRNLPKELWLLLILLVPVVGPIAWLVAGRPVGPAPSVPWRATRTAGFPEYERPRSAQVDEIDERLRRDQARVDREHEEALRRWEADLRARESSLRNPQRPGPDDDAAPKA